MQCHHGLNFSYVQVPLFPDRLQEQKILSPSILKTALRTQTGAKESNITWKMVVSSIRKMGILG